MQGKGSVKHLGGRFKTLDAELEEESAAGTPDYNTGGSTLHSSFLMNDTSRHKLDTLSAEKLSSYIEKYV